MSENAKGGVQNVLCPQGVQIVLPILPSKNREGVNREKLTVKKINKETFFFFTVYVPYKP